MTDLFSRIWNTLIRVRWASIFVLLFAAGALLAGGLEHYQLAILLLGTGLGLSVYAGRE